MSLQSFDSTDSSLIASADYDSDTNQLRITFKRKGGQATYTYEEVPQKVWDGFDAAPSKGQFFSSSIRPLYVGLPT